MPLHNSFLWTFFYETERWRLSAFRLFPTFRHFALWNRAHSTSSYISRISHIKSVPMHSFIHFQLLCQGLDVHCVLRVPYNYLASNSVLSSFLSPSPHPPLAVLSFPPSKVNPAFNRGPVTATLLPLSANTIHVHALLSARVRRGIASIPRGFRKKAS